jgi:hypothetical protein
MDDGLQVGNQGFFDERALDDGAGGESTEYCRLPSDDLPYPESEKDGDIGPCFACTYGARMGDSKRTKTVYDDMCNIIATMYGRTSNEALVNMVHAYYTTEIQRFFNYPNWSKRCIWQHIVMHAQDDVIQTCEAVQTMTAAIELLRESGLCQKTMSGPQLDQKNTRLFLDLVKTREILVANKLKRKAGT